MSNILASSIRDVPHFVAFDTLAKHRLDSIQIDQLLIYIIDTVDAAALPFLAKQFDVLGYKGMRLATTEAEQREVIKRAIELKRRAGTVWAVKEALKTIGYPDAVLVEGAEDGQNGWATFRIELDGGDNTISATAIDELVKMVNEYKNVRSHLVDLSYQIDLGNDPVSLTDESNENASVDESDVVFAGGNFKYNGQVAYNGERNYSQDSDVLAVEIITV
ncbi:phage tail protein I [Pedobacter sp.]|uniref:phage tail protein I n=1 Tax=Pedobacter sp. TaxID=1411316 RepID=UPI003D7F4FDD